MRTIILRNGTGYSVAYGDPIRHFDNAIGYLAAWALASGKFSFVEISIHSDGGMAAAYWANAEQAGAKKPNRPGYFLYGQLAEDGSYSFHS